MRWWSLWLLALGLSVMAGCGTTRAVSVSFPAAWPAHTPPPAMAVSPSLGRGTGMAIAVAPWTWPAASEAAAAPATTDVLTQLTQDALRAHGFEVVDETAARYRLSCSVRDLSYTVTQGYPDRRRYLAEVSCQLLRSEDQRLLWQREVTEHVDDVVYVNTFTRLPTEHERAFIRECLPALMEQLTESLLIFLREELPLASEGLEAPAEPAAHTPTQPYSK